MPLELRTQRDGRLRKTWYGRYEVNGRRIYSNLGIRIAGTPPASHSIKEEGDAAFERSRAAAQAKLESIVGESRTQQGAARLVEKLYEIKTGETLRSVKLTGLAEDWAALPRKRKPSARYRAQSQVTLRRFAGFVARENPKATELAHVTQTLAQAFMAAEVNRGVTARTWNDTLSLLRTTFKALLPAGVVNPFLAVPMRETDTVFRKAFSPEELAAIAATARDDEFIRPLLVTGMCTAMRRGDCCLLQWKDVDLERRFITVKTAKTRQTVSIPIFPMLEEELKRKAESGKDKVKIKNPNSTSHPAPLPNRGGEGMGSTGYVFPEQAKMYLANPDGITWRVKKVLAVALGDRETTESKEQRADKGLPVVSAEEARRRGEEYIGTRPAGEKRERMATVLKLYMDGKSLKQVVTSCGVSQASVSEYLKEIETGIGCRIVRGRPDGRSLAARLKAQPGLLMEERDGGTRRASVRDFHSFRVTWVTLALTAGLPLELVQKVTGHKTTDIVLKHYFQPGREAFRQALQSAMPKLLMNGGPEGQKSEGEGQRAEGGKRDAVMREIIERVTPKTWKRDKARLLELLKGD